MNKGYKEWVELKSVLNNCIRIGDVQEISTLRKNVVQIDLQC